MKKDQSFKIGIILLAAGASRRMGSPKQLLKLDGITLIERAIEVAKNVEAAQTIVVLGANAQKIKAVLQKERAVDIIINDNWQEGMGTTLSTGIQFLLKKTPALEAIIVSVCDQPYLTTEIFEQLIRAYQFSRVELVVSKYAAIYGVPVLFNKNLFPKLLGLKADEGARKIIKLYNGKMAAIDFPKGAIDLDTPAAYQQFLENRNVA